MHGKKQILLTISVMASNRKETTEKCFQSLTRLREEVPCELIVTDTGCDAQMRRMVDSYADKVIEFTWCNDFAKARQVSLDAAQGEWYLYLDDDEWFIDTDELIEFFKGDGHKKSEFATYIQRNFHDWDGTDYSDAWVGRMIKVEPGVHFEDKIHEHLEPIEGKNIAAIASIVEHYGYIHKSPEEERQHYERNTSLLLEMIQEDPQNLRPRGLLMQEYHAAKEYDRLLRCAQEGQELTREKLLANPDQVSEYGVNLTGFYAGELIANTATGQFEAVIKVAEEMMQDPLVTHSGRAYAALYAAHAYVQTKAYAKACEMVQIYREQDAYLNQNPALKFIESSSVFVGKAFDQSSRQRIYSIALIAELKQNDCTHLAEYSRHLGWDQHSLYIYEGLLDTIGEAMARPLDPVKDSKTADIWKQALTTYFENAYIWDKLSDLVMLYDASEDHDELPLLEKLALVDRYDWILSYAKMRTIDGHQLEKYFLSMPPEVWQKELEAHLQHRGWLAVAQRKEYFAQIKSCEDPRYDYLDLFVQELTVRYGLERLTIEEQKQQFLAYAHALEARIATKIPMQLPSIELAKHLICAFETADHMDHVKELHHVAVEYPDFAPSIRTFLVREEAEENDRKREARAEMEALKAQILATAEQLIAQGQKEQAKAILSQLQMTTKNDLEVAEMLLRANML